MRSALVLLGLSAVAAVAAQRPVITVGGTNANYANLPAAVAAAAPGSVLLVRPGNYTGFSTGKPLRVVLDFTSQTGVVSAPSGAAYAIEITGLPAGGDFVLVGRGARVTSGTLGGLRVVNCSGRVVLDGIDASLSATKVGLDVQNAAAVAVQDSTFAGLSGLTLRDAVLTACDTAWSSPVGFGLTAVRGTLELTLGSYVGTGAPAIRVVDTAVRLAGDGATSIAVTGSTSVPVSAFEAINSDVQWDAATFVLQPKNGAASFLPVGGQVFPVEVPVLDASGAAPGAQMSASLSRATPAVGIIALGNFTTPHTAGRVAGVWLDETAPMVLLAVGTVDSNGLSRLVTWPNVPWLLGELFCCQGFVALGNGSIVRSGPGIWPAM